MIAQNNEIKQGSSTFISRRNFLKNCAIAGGALTLPLPGAAADAQENDEIKPNIIMFISDDHGIRDCGPYGATDVKTPNLDRLAAESLKFNRAYAVSSTCVPTRTSIYTGLNPLRHGAHRNHSAMNGRHKTYAWHLRGLGHHSALIGKCHLKPQEFLSMDTFITGATLHDQRMMSEVDEFLTKNKGEKPFCLVVATHDPHVGWDYAEEYGYTPEKVKIPPNHLDTPSTRKARVNYYCDITTMDKRLGDVLDMVDRHGLKNNTVFIYTADQGGQWPFAKWNLYDDGIRMPLLVRWPGVIKGGTETDAMVSQVDLPGTFIELAGGKIPEPWDSRSFLPLLKGETDTHRDMIFAMQSEFWWDINGGVPARSVFDGRYKYIVNLLPEMIFRTPEDDWQKQNYFGEWEKLARNGNPRALKTLRRYHWRPKEELYDLKNDPYEQHNLIDESRHEKTLARLRSELAAWRKQQNDPGLDMTPERKQEILNLTKKYESQLGYTRKGLRE